MSDKLVSPSVMNSATLKEQVFQQQKLLSGIAALLNRFAFISKAQWMLLVLLNFTCLIFILLALRAIST